MEIRTCETLLGRVLLSLYFALHGLTLVLFSDLSEFNNSFTELLCSDEDSGNEDVLDMEYNETEAEDLRRNAEVNCPLALPVAPNCDLVYLEQFLLNQHLLIKL